MPMLANAGGLVYGTILVATLFAAESARQETYAKTLGAVGLTLIAYWLSISYSEYTGERLQREEHFHYAGFARVALRETTLLLGAAVPIVVLLVFWAAGAKLTTAVEVDIWFAAGTIVAIEVVTGIRSRLTGHELVRQTLFGALLGLLVIALRVLLH